MTEPVFATPVETVRRRELEATQRLLGDTIELDDSQWLEPSALPGWTRAHVAAHLSRGADALLRVTAAAVRGEAEPLYPDPTERFAAIERGTSRTGLEHQIDLDTSAGALASALDLVQDWSAPIRLLGRQLTLAQVPLARLQEVVLHHIDLASGFTEEDLDPVPARWLLQWHVAVRHPDRGPLIQVESDSGVSHRVGAEGPVRTVQGSDAHLWAWLTGRGSGDRLTGVDGLALPLL